MMALPSRKKWAGGFTLIEMMTVVVIAGVLLTLIFVATQNLTDKGNTARCIGNLRQIGVALMSHAAEHGGKIPARIERDPDNPAQYSAATYWHKVLRDKGYLDGRLTAKNSVFRCPSLPIVTSVDGNYQTYGMRVWCVPGSSFDVPQSLLAIEKPADFFLMVDSYATPFKTQGYHVHQGPGWQIHLRHHDGEANTLFADGHVAPKGAEYFDRISVEQAIYGGNNLPFQYRKIKTP